MLGLNLAGFLVMLEGLLVGFSPGRRLAFEETSTFGYSFFAKGAGIQRPFEGLRKRRRLPNPSNGFLDNTRLPSRAFEGAFEGLRKRQHLPNPSNGFFGLGWASGPRVGVTQRA